jgi:hypothetical protein
MWTIPGQPLLDKHRLVAGCVRLALGCDAQRLRDEVASLPEHYWGSQGGRVGVHAVAQAVFLRGHAPAEGNLPIEEREALRYLPGVSELINATIPAPPQRCLLAILPAGAVIAPHIDQVAPYFSQTLRVHVPIATNEQVWMYCDGMSYQMAAGEVWVLNNSALHGVWNASATKSRLHLICDYLPTPALLDLIAGGDANLGRHVAEVAARLLPGQGAAART